MERLLEKGNWTLFSSYDVPELTELYGEDFKDKYVEYENEFKRNPSKFNKETKTIPAVELMRAIAHRYIEDGNPFIFFHDTVNRKNPHKDLGIIRSSNLCFTGDTIIKTAAGDKTIEELYQVYGSKTDSVKDGEKFIVHGSTLNTTTGKNGIVKKDWNNVTTPAIVFKTGRCKVVRVTLNNGGTFKCTPNHPLAKSNGGYVEAINSVNHNVKSFDNAHDIFVVKVEELKEEYDVYDLNVPATSNFYISVNRLGILVHNCQEILMPTDYDKTAVCNLGSINLARCNTDEDLIRVTRLATRSMDNCIDLTIYPSNESEHWQKKLRSTGLGTLGLAEYLANSKIVYGSEEHKSELHRIYGTISRTIKEESENLAKEKGECLVKGVRNAYRMAIAPNSSSAMFAGTTNSHELVYNLLWMETSRVGTYPVTAPHISLDNINYYKTPYQIDPFLQIEMTSIIQDYIDQSISHNVYIDPNQYENGVPLSKIRDIIVHAWKHNIKTLYYCRSKAKQNGEIKENKIVCSGCEN